MKKIKVFYPEELFNENERGLWFELIKSKERLSRKSSELDASIQKNIVWTSDEKHADLWLLPMHWNYYFDKGEEKLAFQFCLKGKEFDKIVWSHSGGDLGITIKVPENVIVYRQAGYKSQLKMNERVAPFLLSDPVGKFVANEDQLWTEENTQPKVGFCGMAPHGLKVELKERVQIIVRNLKTRLGIIHEDTQQILSSSNLRYNALMELKKAKNVTTNYIIRQKYRGGSQSKENREKTTTEYYQNQLESDLILCVRGVGNFSLRFYETLAMGRVPIFIDTDSPLPDISPLNWDDFIIAVHHEDYKSSSEIIESWLSKRLLQEQKKKNRGLWVSHFRSDNFWNAQLESIGQ